MAERTDSHLSEGTMLAHYRIETLLGSGAMGRVYLAHDTSLERKVAVKVLHDQIAKEPEIVRRFQREARAAARVNHPNLTHVYFVGEERDRRFFAMEYVPGLSLFDHVEENGPMPFESVIDALVQAIRGLSAAHEANVIHRDVKPSNLMLLPNHTLKVADFGLAKSMEADVDATGAGRVMGTPRYMSPEQCRGEDVSPATDWYAVGLVAYFALTGEHAFDGTSLGKVINDQMNSPLPRLEEKVSGLPPTLQEVLDKLCSKKQAERPQTAEEVIALLESARPRKLDLAPLASRIAALAVDGFVVGVLLFAVLGGLAALTNLLLHVDLSGAIWEWMNTVLTVAVVAATQVLMEWRYGGSPGKLAFSLRVTHESGTRPSLVGLLLRFLLRFPIAVYLVVPPQWTAVHFVIWGLQVLAVAAGATCFFVLQRRTLSDVLTRTRVVHQPRGSRD